MKNKKKTPGFVSSIFFTITLIVLFAAAILCINYFLNEKLKKEQFDREYEIVTSVVENEFDNNPLLEKITITSVDGKEKMELYPFRKNEIVNAVAIKVGNERGYGGYMELVVGFYMDGSISNYRITRHNETIGLGSKVLEKSFSEQFEAFHPERQTFKVKKDGGDIDAVTAATISSRAVIDSIQKAYDAYKKFIVGD